MHQTLDYNQIYNFTLEHDYKLKIIIVLTEVWISKSKNVYVFLFFECFEHMDPFLWNILKLQKKIEMIWGTFTVKQTKEVVDKALNYIYIILENHH